MKTIDALEAALAAATQRADQAEAALAAVRQAQEAAEAQQGEREQMLFRALGNCYAMAKREIARISNGKAQCDVTSLERWRHVQRFCEETGHKSSILRASLPTEITDGALPAPPCAPVGGRGSEDLGEA